jgi:hypothetical protein
MKSTNVFLFAVLPAIILLIVSSEIGNKGNAAIENSIGNTEVETLSKNILSLVGFGSSGSDSGSSDSGGSSDSSSGSGSSGSESSSADSSDSSSGEAGSGVLGEGTIPCAEGGSPKVDVRATHIEGLSLLPIWHLFIIYTDCDGTEHFYRGGPGGPDETIKGTSGPYTSETIDWDPDARSVTVAEGDPALGAGDCFESELSRIENTRTPYENMGPNSNTVAKTLISKCGFPVEKPVNIAPGWGDPEL